MCSKKVKAYIGYTQEQEWYVILITYDLIQCECKQEKGWFSLQPPFSLEKWLQSWKKCENYVFQNKKIVWKTTPTELYKVLLKNKNSKYIDGNICGRV